MQSYWNVAVKNVYVCTFRQFLSVQSLNTQKVRDPRCMHVHSACMQILLMKLDVVSREA